MTDQRLTWWRIHHDSPSPQYLWQYSGPVTAGVQADDSRWIDRRMALAREWDELVEQVREIPGFAEFLKPPPLDTLLAGATGGPVAVVNVSRWRSDALVVHADGVETVALPALTADDVHRWTTEYLAVLRDGTPSTDGLSFTEALDARRKARARRETVLLSTMEWLWDAVADPVLSHLGHTAQPGPDEPWPRVWWCPTGLLTLLPLHGAGHHGAGDGRTVLDRVVSSYTPTLRALAQARAAAPAAGTDGLLFVGVPDAPGQLHLTEEVDREREFLRARFGAGLTVLEGAGATVETVHDAMARHGRVHVSCHGRQDLDDPSSAGLVLTDGNLTISRLATARYTGEFVFLSACRTATGGVHLPDEVITLAAALSYTGYRHVLATIWSVDPAVAAELAESVYGVLLDGDRFDPDRSAHALHTAVRALRERGCPLDDWLPFTHNGP